jgi:hypothetical protein
MVFSSTITGTYVMGNKRVAYGTYNCTGATGGDVSTGLGVIEQFYLQPEGGTVSSDASAVNETFPLTTAVTIVTDNGEVGYWRAIGH